MSWRDTRWKAVRYSSTLQLWRQPECSKARWHCSTCLLAEPHLGTVQGEGWQAEMMLADAILLRDRAGRAVRMISPLQLNALKASRQAHARFGKYSRPPPMRVHPCGSPCCTQGPAGWCSRARDNRAPWLQQ